MQSVQTYQIALTLLNGVGYILSKVLLSKLHTAENVFLATKKELMAIEKIGEHAANQIIKTKEQALERAEQEVAFLQKHPEIKTHFYTQKTFPNRLKYCDDSPLLLYTSGKMDLNQQKIIAIVGTRKMTNYGRRLIQDFLYQLKGSNILVVSGMAYGVDTFAHKTSVELGLPTVGVLAHGLDLIYPASNKGLANKMKHNGGLVTEYVTNTIPNRENFPARNRIIAGLADATIIVESDRKGGSLITADIAASYHRDVFAFPGEVGKRFSTGCNNLIKRQKALLIETGEDLFYNLGWENHEQTGKSRQRQLFVELNQEEQKIANLLQNKSLTANELSINSSLPLSIVRTHLLNLELKGVVRISPGNKFALN